VDPGLAAILGAAVGIIGTLLTTLLQHHLQTKPAKSLAEKRRARLMELLTAEGYQWRTMATLSAAIGASEEATAELLLQLDARTSDTDRKIWGLISRNPISQ
jgi:hypothetical protein